jgi:hypothetical protein
MEQLSQDFHLSLVDEEPALTSFSISPKFGIGQRAFLVETPEGNLQWDCISLLNDELAEFIGSRGGLTAIAISHPHYYTTMVDWSERFGVPIYVHEEDREWVMRPAPTIVPWSGGQRALFGGLRLVRRALPRGERPPGVARCAVYRGHHSGVPRPAQRQLMYSYPNHIPLNAVQVQRILAAVEPLAFDRIYGAFPQMTIPHGGKHVLQKSAQRYLQSIADQSAG